MSVIKITCPSTPHTALTRRERLIMDILYRRGRATAAEVLEDLSGTPSYSTVRTQLRVLEEKGHVRHEEEGLRYVYVPAVPRHAARKSALRHLVDTFFDGSAEKVVGALLGGEGARLSEDELRADRRAGRQGKEREWPMKITVDRRARARRRRASLRRQPAALRHWVLACAVACAAATRSCRCSCRPGRSASCRRQPIAAGDCRDRPALRRTAAPAAGRRPQRTPRRRAPRPPTAARTPPLVLVAGGRLDRRRVDRHRHDRRRPGPPVVARVSRPPDRRSGRGGRSPTDLDGARAAAPRSLCCRANTRRCSSPGERCGRRSSFRRRRSTWPRERIGIVLRHELAHVQRGDWAVQVAAELLKSVYWFNPVLWVVGRRLRLESEHACDDAVMNSGIEASSYASHLVDLARALNQPPRTGCPRPPSPVHPASTGGSAPC